MKQFIKFSIIGSIGFIVDALVLLSLVHILSFSIELSRLFSFLVAVFITWILNRNFTFNKDEEANKKKEYSKYLIIQSIGALINYSIFITLVYSFEFFENNLIVPLAIASIIAMFFNFYIIKIRIYK